MIRLDQEKPKFTGNSIDSPVTATLEITKNNRQAQTYFQFTRRLPISIYCLSALLRRHCVLHTFGINGGTLVPAIVRNNIQSSRRKEHEIYRNTIRQIATKAEISDSMSEHSTHRGGAVYYYFIMRWDLMAIYRCFKWESFGQMINYIYVEDQSYSFALARFTALGKTKLCYGA